MKKNENAEIYTKMARFENTKLASYIHIFRETLIGPRRHGFWFVVSLGNGAFKTYRLNILNQDFRISIKFDIANR